jgi:CHAT domain-containing protein
MGGADFDHLEAEPTVAGVAASSRSDPEAAMRGAAPDCDAFRRVRFDPLEGSESECREVASLWRRHGASGVGNAKASGRSAQGLAAPSSERVLVLTGPAASEQVFKRLAPGYSALHLATHGFFVDPQCAARGDSGEVQEAVETHPLLLSGLVLAGANQRSGDATVEDGLLTAEEIASLDLRSADWVALSACGTGLGTIVAKEGVFGLRRAFELAGAGTVIMSLWSVKDIDSSRWMRALYQARVAHHLPAAEAVRKASLETLAELRAQGESTLPARWGAFVACGDWR